MVWNGKCVPRTYPGVGQKAWKALKMHENFGGLGSAGTPQAGEISQQNQGATVPRRSAKTHDGACHPTRPVPRLTPIQVARFWSKVVVDRFTDTCWPWRGKRGADGYGLYAIPGDATYRAHRIAYALVEGDPPPGAMILHSCDNRLCCNPEHLRPGTAQENSNDAVSRGRTNTGRRKLTPEQVQVIRDNPEINGARLAREYGVSKAAVSMARNGHTHRGVK